MAEHTVKREYYSNYHFNFTSSDRSERHLSTISHSSLTTPSVEGMMDELVLSHTQSLCQPLHSTKLSIDPDFHVKLCVRRAPTSDTTTALPLVHFRLNRAASLYSFSVFSLVLFGPLLYSQPKSSLPSMADKTAHTSGDGSIGLPTTNSPRRPLSPFPNAVDGFASLGSTAAAPTTDNTSPPSTVPPSTESDLCPNPSCKRRAKHLMEARLKVARLEGELDTVDRQVARSEARADKADDNLAKLIASGTIIAEGSLAAVRKIAEANHEHSTSILKMVNLLVNSGVAPPLPDDLQGLEAPSPPHRSKAGPGAQVTAGLKHVPAKNASTSQSNVPRFPVSTADQRAAQTSRSAPPSWTWPANVEWPAHWGNMPSFPLTPTQAKNLKQCVICGFPSLSNNLKKHFEVHHKKYTHSYTLDARKHARLFYVKPSGGELHLALPATSRLEVVDVAAVKKKAYESWYDGDVTNESSPSE